MTRYTAVPVLADVPQKVIEELDLGPMRIISCKHIRDGKLGHYVLSVSAAGSIIQIITSGGGNIVRVMKDGAELGRPGISESTEITEET